MLSLTSVLLGFLVGFVAAAIAFQLGFVPKRQSMTEATTVWDLASLASEPRILAERLDGVRLPPGAKIIVPLDGPALPDAVLEKCEVRTHPAVHENAALGRNRVLLFTTRIREGAFAVGTRDPAVVMRMEAQWNRLWKDADPYVRIVAFESVKSSLGSTVEVRGTAAGVMDYRGARVLRLEAQGRALPVLVDRDHGHAGQAVRVVGTVVEEHGLTAVRADRVVPMNAVPA